MLNQPSLAPIPKFSLNNLKNSHLNNNPSLTLHFTTNPPKKVQKRENLTHTYIDLLQPYSKGVLSQKVSHKGLSSSKMMLDREVLIIFHGNKFKRLSSVPPCIKKKLRDGRSSGKSVLPTLIIILTQMPNYPSSRTLLNPN